MQVDNEGNDDGGEAANEAIRAEALAMGWQPEENFRGDKSKFIPAADFVERGKTLLPLIRKENAKVKADNQALRGELAEVKKLVQASQESIDNLLESSNQINIQRAKDARTELATQLAKARKDGNVEQEVKLQEQISDATDAIKTAEKAPEKRKEAAKEAAKETLKPPALDPATQRFMAENDWFGTDQRKTRLFLAAADIVRAEKPELFGKGDAFYAAALAEFESITPEPRKTNKVESGATGGGGESGGSSQRGKTFADLPEDAKLACKQTSGRLVGPGKTFKTEADWQKHYAKEYFSKP